MNGELRMKKKIIWGLIIIAGLAAIVISISTMLGNKTVEVKVSFAEKGKLTETLYANGVLEPVKQFEYYAPYSGQIAQLLVKEGDHVAANQLLFAMNVEEYEEQIALERMNADMIKIERDRAKSEHKKEHILKLRDNPEAYVEPFDGSSYQLQLDKIELLLSSYRKKVKQSEIIAAAAGTVKQIHVKEGEIAGQGSLVIDIDDLSSFQVKANLSEIDVNKVAIGMPVVIFSDAITEEQQGKIIAISSYAHSVDSNSDASVEVIIGLEEQAGQLRAGNKVSVEIRLEDEARLLIPIDSILYDKEQAYVYKLELDTVVKVNVTTGKENDTAIEITSGLNENDQVVTEGAVSLQDGAKVTVK